MRYRWRSSKDELVDIGRFDEKDEYYFTLALICRRQDGSRYAIEMPINHLYTVVEYEVQNGNLEDNILVTWAQDKGTKISINICHIIAHAAETYPSILFPVATSLP